MSVKDTRVDSPWSRTCSSPDSAPADVTDSPPGATSLADDVTASEDEALDLSRRSRTGTVAAAAAAVSASDDVIANSGWCDVTGDDDDNAQRHMMTSLPARTPFANRSCGGRSFYL